MTDPMIIPVLLAAWLVLLFGAAGLEYADKRSPRFHRWVESVIDRILS